MSTTISDTYTEPAPLTGDEIRALREGKGWSQSVLAEASGLSSHAVISNIERGMRCAPATMGRIRSALQPATDSIPPMTRLATKLDPEGN
jgi:hypothetical protein